jgi:hypothetical protein
MKWYYFFLATLFSISNLRIWYTYEKYRKHRKVWEKYSYAREDWALWDAALSYSDARYNDLRKKLNAVEESLRDS